VLIAIAAYGGWYKLSGDGRPDSEPVEPVPPRMMALAEAPAPLRAPAVAPAPVASEAVDAGPAMPAVSPSSAAAAIPPHVVVAPAEPPAAVVAVAPAGDGSRIVLRAKADAWMQVRDAKGNVLLNRVLHAAETWPVPGKGLLLTTGNAGGTEILVDGKPTASLGGDGAVRRDMALDADPIRDGKLAVAAPSATAPVAPKPQ
jgi:cytoskeleton protein RodZ